MRQPAFFFGLLVLAALETWSGHIHYKSAALHFEMAREFRRVGLGELVAGREKIGDLSMTQAGLSLLTAAMCLVTAAVTQ